MRKRTLLPCLTDSFRSPMSVPDSFTTMALYKSIYLLTYFAIIVILRENVMKLLI